MEGMVMGKFLESIGLIDGYDIIAIGKMKAKKIVYLKKLKNVIIQ